MKRRVDELDEMALALDHLVESPEIAAELNTEAVDLLEAMLQLAPEDQVLEVSLHNAQQLTEELRNPTRERDINRIQDSDAAIARSLYLLNEAGRILRKRQSKGKLELSRMESYIHELAWSHLMVGVTTHVAQGHKCVKKGNILRGFAFYKKAQEVAIQTSTQDTRRHQLISELSDIMSNRRKSLSPELMPEVGYNPPEHSLSAENQAAG